MNSELLKHLRLQRGETRRAVAMATGLTENSILLYESGRANNPRLDTLKALSDHFGIEIGDLISDEECGRAEPA